MSLVDHFDNMKVTGKQETPKVSVARQFYDSNCDRPNARKKALKKLKDLNVPNHESDFCTIYKFGDGSELWIDTCDWFPLD